MIHKEPKIIINGSLLSNGASMTIRVALEHFAVTLTTEGLGNDKAGREICKGYLNRILEIRKAIFK